MDTKAKILQGYKDLAIQNGRLPVSIIALCEKAGVERIEFNKLFANLTEVEEGVWMEYFYTTIHTIEGSDVYAEYMVREKLLAFYFTFFEILRDDREFVALFSNQFGVWNYNPPCLAMTKPLFTAFVAELVEEGKATEEVAERYVLGGDYPGWHWPQFLYLLNFWVNDKSADFARTDQAIEKSVNFGFDIMGRNVFDSAFDLARFIFTGTSK